MVDERTRRSYIVWEKKTYPAVYNIRGSHPHACESPADGVSRLPLSYIQLGPSDYPVSRSLDSGDSRRRHAKAIYTRDSFLRRFVNSNESSATFTELSRWRDPCCFFSPWRRPSLWLAQLASTNAAAVSACAIGCRPCNAMVFVMNEKWHREICESSYI